MFKKVINVIKYSVNKVIIKIKLDLVKSLDTSNNVVPIVVNLVIIKIEEKSINLIVDIPETKHNKSSGNKGSKNIKNKNFASLLFILSKYVSTFS